MTQFGAAKVSIEAVSVAVNTGPRYLPVTEFGGNLPVQVLTPMRSGQVPREHLIVQVPEELDEPGVAALALAALGRPERDQPLFLVRSGPLRDPLTSLLARLDHDVGWGGSEVGITLLEELGGTLVFDMLSWALYGEDVGTVLICDEPLYADARRGSPRFCAVGLRVRPCPGPLRVLACGEGVLPATAAPPRSINAGCGPCDGWLALHAALAAGEIRDGDRVLLRTQARAGAGRDCSGGWLLIEAADVAGLELAVPVVRGG